MLGDRLTLANLDAEAGFFRRPQHRSLERLYGWGWLLTLHHELPTWADVDGGAWRAALDPLADSLVDLMVTRLPKLTYPQRTGVHPNTAFSRSRSLDHAGWRAARGDTALLDHIQHAAERFYATDTDYPAHYERSGTDVLSPALTEAELMSRLLPAGEFSG